MSYYIGIDPSTSKTGYAVLDNKGTLVTQGALQSKADDPVAFQQLYQDLLTLLKTYPPSALICEHQFTSVNMSVTIKISRPTGLVLAATGLYPECQFQFSPPNSWRKIYHTGTDYEKKYTKKNSFEVTKQRFPGVVSSFNKDNDISDAIGIAYACWKLYGQAAA